MRRMLQAYRQLKHDGETTGAAAFSGFTRSGAPPKRLRGE